MVYKGFRSFKPQGDYLVSSAHNDSYGDGIHYGQYRVKFEWSPCDIVTVVAQQIESNKGFRTFRKWNPKKISVPYGQETGADNDRTYCNPICCCVCIVVSYFMDSIFEEVVDFLEEEHKSAESIF